MKFDDTFFKEQMKALSVNFVAHMEEPIQKLDHYIMLIEQNLFTQEHKTELCSIAHNYKGTGTTYGFKDITKTAKILEDKLLKMPYCKEQALVPLIVNLRKTMQLARDN